jgi:hypothetical protein
MKITNGKIIKFGTLIYKIKDISNNLKKFESEYVGFNATNANIINQEKTSNFNNVIEEEEEYVSSISENTPKAPKGTCGLPPIHPSEIDESEEQMLGDYQDLSNTQNQEEIKNSTINNHKPKRHATATKTFYIDEKLTNMYE